jgi:hypothetical protein
MEWKIHCLVELVLERLKPNPMIFINRIVISVNLADKALSFTFLLGVTAVPKYFDD